VKGNYAAIAPNGMLTVNVGIAGMNLADNVLPVLSGIKKMFAKIVNVTV